MSRETDGWGPVIDAVIARDGGVALADALLRSIDASAGALALPGDVGSGLRQALAQRGFTIAESEQDPAAVVVADHGACFHESLQSARARLALGGMLAVVGLFAHEHARHDAEPVAQLDYLRRAASRCGLRDCGFRDLSGAALGALPAHPRHSDLRSGLERGVYACGVQCFETVSPAPRWSVHEVGEDDFEDLAALFGRVFEAELTPRTWRWKYGDGRGQGILARRAGAAVAYYGGVSRSIRYFGEPRMAVQICDVMVDQRERGVLTRRGPFFLCAATFLERYIGYGLKHLLGYGFPTHRAMAAAQRQGLYAAVGEMCEAQWSPQARRPLGASARALQPARDARTVDDLWRRMMEQMRGAIIGERDWAYVEHRYLQHPSKRYELVLVSGRLSRRPRVLMVLRSDAGRYELLDLIGAPRYFAAAVQWARCLARERGARDLYCWVSRGFASQFEAMGAQCVPLDVCNPTGVWTRGPEPERLRDRWWFTSGDTDFR